MKTRLGSFEKRIIDYLEKNGPTYTPIIYHSFAPWKRRAGERNGHLEFFRVRDVLIRLAAKGLIHHSRKGFMDDRIELKKGDSE